MSKMAKGTGTENLSIRAVQMEKDHIRAEISDGRIIFVPLAWFPSLANADDSQRQRFEISPSGYGIHWPDLDEDISIKSFIA